MNKRHGIAFGVAGAIHAAVLLGLSSSSQHEPDQVESVDVSLFAEKPPPPPEIEPQDESEDELEESLLPDEFLASSLAEPPPTSLAMEAITQLVRPDPPRLPRLDGMQTIGIPTSAQRKASGSQMAGEIFLPGDLDSPPALRFEQEPKYPYELKKAGATGRVIVLMVVDPSGRVIKADVESATHDEFGRSAQAACLKWRFEPGLRHGRPVAFLVRVPFDFN